MHTIRRLTRQTPLKRKLHLPVIVKRRPHQHLKLAEELELEQHVDVDVLLLDQDVCQPQ